MSDDAQLLRQFADEGSEEAFRQLVERHLPLVNATARRVLAGDVHLAQDVTQVVFTDLARKAATLPTGVVLGGWLYRHTCYTALKAIRSENRRRTRERTAMEITALNESSAGDAHWLQLAPVLDDALNQLGAEDRDAIVLRYLQQQDVRSIGRAMGASENAAQKRLGRALEKLRAILTRRGITVSSALLATALDAGAATAPLSAGLAASISTNALVGASATASTTTLLTALKTMITSKLALGVAAAIVAIGATTVIIQSNSASDSPAPAPAAQAPTASAVKTPVTVAAAPAKVEAPKAAPAPAGGEAIPNATYDSQIEPNTINIANSASGTLTFNTANPFAGGGSGGTLVLTGPATATRRVTGGGFAGNGSGATTRSVSMVNGQMIITTTSPDGTVNTQSLPTTGATVSGGVGQGVISFTDANGNTHTQVIATPDDGSAPMPGGTVIGNGTMTIMGTTSTSDATTGATFILGTAGDASDSSPATNTANP